jgi:hypothetical protein
VRRAAKMPDEDWIKTLEDGRKVKFTSQELPRGAAFITAQIAGNKSRLFNRVDGIEEPVKP